MCKYCENIISTFEDCDNWYWGQRVVVNILERPHKKGKGLVRLDIYDDHEGAPLDDQCYYLVDHKLTGKPILETKTNPDYCPWCGRELYSFMRWLYDEDYELPEERE